MEEEIEEENEEDWDVGESEFVAADDFEESDVEDMEDTFTDQVKIKISSNRPPCAS